MRLLNRTDSDAVAAACTHPLDLTKVCVISHLNVDIIRSSAYRDPTSRLQTIPASDGYKPSMLSVLRMTVAKTGVRSLYTGLSAAFLRQMSYSLVRLGSYEKMKEALSKNGRPSGGNLLLCAMAAGAMGGIAGNPAGKCVHC